MAESVAQPFAQTQPHRLAVVAVVFPIARLPIQAAMACSQQQVLSAHHNAQAFQILMAHEEAKVLVLLALQLTDTRTVQVL